MLIPKTKVLAAICAFTGIISILFLYLFSKSISEGFPYIKPGSYLGEIDGLESSTGARPQRLVFDKSNSDDRLIIAISGQESFSEVINNIKIEGAHQSGMLLTPPKIKFSENEYQLSGKEDKPGGYSGKIINLKNGRSVRWSVSLVDEYPAIRNSKDLDTIREFLSLRNELNEADTSINVAEIGSTQQKTEIERLTHFITEGESLKRNAQEKLIKIKDELEKVKAEFASKQSEVKALNEKLELSQRLTATGRLVSLARESLDRERRWADSMNKTTLSDSALDFDNVVGRGERIILLKNEIDIETAKIERLLDRKLVDRKIEVKSEESKSNQESGEVLD